ncbi:hypothetical protein GTQ34_03490 [Muricauda sp. JGD-17]|uniref:Uncharacterized protein n=1 Tax=Flagellimonas ochracea TaxID=2696472 RepID=A0A964T9Z1_9FLAO|nr:hypothetical protein [Allomuricauda ochracea]NAY90973.1 hypothetical protein [Allomuricauda ochracea]
MPGYGTATETLPKIDSTNFEKIYPYALRGNMNAVFEILDVTENNSLTEKQRDKKKKYHERFLYKCEDFDYNTDDVVLVDLYNRFQHYWRSVLVENVPQKLVDSIFRGEMIHFLKKNYKPELTIEKIQRDYYTLFQDFFISRNTFGIGIGKTGHLYDLYLWKEQEEKAYSIDLPEGQTIEVPVVFMRGFISNGWSHYTTFGHSFSGGWAMKDKLFCVEESYGPKDEEAFLISYVSHEGQHFSDYTLFPKLKQIDLEYRAKLTELSLTKETTHDIVNKFITNAKNDTSFAHAFANYTVIRMLSDKIFVSDFESDLEKWEQIPVKRINKIALKLLKDHSKQLKALGADSVEAYIKAR